MLRSEGLRGNAFGAASPPRKVKQSGWWKSGPPRPSTQEKSERNRYLGAAGRHREPYATRLGEAHASIRLLAQQSPEFAKFGVVPLISRWLRRGFGKARSFGSPSYFAGCLLWRRGYSVRRRSIPRRRSSRFCASDHTTRGAEEGFSDPAWN